MQQSDFNYLYCTTPVRPNNLETNAIVNINCNNSVDDTILLQSNNVDQQINDCITSNNSMSIQLHRASTDNDRVGYINIWDAVGLDHSMHCVPITLSHKYHNTSSTSTTTSSSSASYLVGKEVEEFQEDINYLSSEYLLVYQSSILNNDTTNNTNKAVNCSWSMQPYKPINKMKIRILSIFNLFLCNQNEDVREVYIPFTTSDEEAFIHFLGIGIII